MIIKNKIDWNVKLCTLAGNPLENALPKKLPRGLLTQARTGKIHSKNRPLFSYHFRHPINQNPMENFQ
jgi:hypothetical protein